MVTDSDPTLVQLARAGDKEAFACLLTRHLPLMRGVCRRFLGPDDGLEDVLQEAALQALLGLDRLRDAAQVGPWLTGIALNVARRSRRQRTEYAWSWDALSGGGLVREPIEEHAGPAQLAEASELAQTVRRAVAELPAGQRAAVLLVYLSGLTYRETAAVLGIDPGAVKTRLHKGRRSLQHRLRDLWMENLMTISVEQQMIEMRVEDVRRHTVESDTQPVPRSVVVLRESHGERRLRIWVGNWEGDAIAMLLEKLKVPRPLTHALTASLLRAGGVRVTEVRIHRLAEETFYAQIVLQGTLGEQTVDSRPSDCIALALELSAPIYVASDVLSAIEAARLEKPETRLPESIGAKQIVDELVACWPHEPKPVR
jgi:RNA polymerase sigma factor (sigma-70 family)